MDISNMARHLRTHMNIITGLNFSCWQKGSNWIFCEEFVGPRSAKSCLSGVAEEIFQGTLDKDITNDIFEFSKDTYGYILSEDDVTQAYIGLRATGKLQTGYAC